MQRKFIAFILLSLVFTLVSTSYIYADKNGEDKLNINTATVKQLIELPGIGKKVAERIISKREEIGQFKSVENLKTIKGIGKKKFEEIKSLIIVEEMKKTE